MELFSRAILAALAGFHSEDAQGPTVSQLATSLGIPVELGRDRLVERLQRQIMLGRVAHYEWRFTLTSAGLRALGREADRPKGLARVRAARR